MTSTRKCKRQYNKLKKRKTSKNSKKRGKRGKRIIRHKGGEDPKLDIYINFSKKIYEIIDANLGLFIIDDFIEDHSMNLDALHKYIKYQTESNKKSVPFWNFYEYLYKNILYITNSDIINQYETNAHEIYNLSTKKSADGMNNHIVFLLSDKVDKSNFYCALYFLHLYRKMYPLDYQNIKVLCESEMSKEAMGHSSDEDKIHFNYDSEYTIYITTDDFSYSGEQLHYLIDLNYRYHLPHKVHSKSDNYSIYINVVGMTYYALKNISPSPYWVKIIIPEKCMIIKNRTYNEIFDKYCKEYNYNITRDSVDLFYFTNTYVHPRSFTNLLMGRQDLPLIYLSYKYPDHISFPTDMCYIRDIPNIYLIAYSDYNEKNTVIFDDNIISKDVMFHEKCSKLDFIFQLRSMEQFKEKYPDLVYDIDSNKYGIIHVLKLFKNCNYESMSMDSDNGMNCNRFCYKPFYKKKQYVKNITDFLIKAGIIFEMETNNAYSYLFDK